jgi:hypothetical protein
VKFAFISKRLERETIGCVPSAALIVRDTVGLTEDSVYVPSVKIKMSPAVAAFTADLSVPLPGATSIVVTLNVIAHKTAQQKEIKRLFMVIIYWVL